MTICIYGMRLRGFAPGCQPMNGFQSSIEGEAFDTFSEWVEEAKGRTYHAFLVYNRELTEAECDDYELDKICHLVPEVTDDEG